MPNANLNSILAGGRILFSTLGRSLITLSDSTNTSSILSSLQGVGEPIPSRGRTCDVIVQ